MAWVEFPIFKFTSTSFAKFLSSSLVDRKSDNNSFVSYLFQENCWQKIAYICLNDAMRNVLKLEAKLLIEPIHKMFFVDAVEKNFRAFVCPASERRCKTIIKKGLLPFAQNKQKSERRCLREKVFNIQKIHFPYHILLANCVYGKLSRIVHSSQQITISENVEMSSSNLCSFSCQKQQLLLYSQNI